MVQAPSSTGANHLKSRVVVDGPVADVSVSGAFDGVAQHPDVEMVDALCKAAAEPDVASSECAHSSAIVFGKDNVETIELAA